MDSGIVKPVPRLLTVDQVAEWLQVTPAWVRSHANGNRRPKLPSVKMGRFRRFRREDVEAFLRQYSSEGTAA